MRGCFPLLTLPLALAGCTTAEPPPRVEAPAPQVVVEEPELWEQIASEADRNRLVNLDFAWTAALAEARTRGFRRAIAAEGVLLDPAARLPRAAPPPGPYRCRVIKLGQQGRRSPAFTAFKPFFCYVEAEADLLTIVKQTGTQRPAGRLYPHRDDRLIFLGTLALGSEEAPLAYAADPKRDMAGVFERVAPFRYRLVIPWPQSESKLDVFELVPVTQTS